MAVNVTSCPAAGTGQWDHPESTKVESHSPGSQEYPAVQEVLAHPGVPRSRQPGRQASIEVVKNGVESRVPTLRIRTKSGQNRKWTGLEAGQ